MKWLVTWTLEVEAESVEQAREFAQQEMLEGNVSPDLEILTEDDCL